MDLFIRPRLIDPRIVPTEDVEVDWTHPLARSLMAFWPLGGTKPGGDLTGRFDGSLSSSAPLPVISARGPAMEFNGSSNSVDFGPAAPLLNIRNNFSISAWIALPSSPGSGIAWFGATSGGIEPSISLTSMQMTFSGVIDYASVALSLTTGTWYFVTYTVDSNNIAYYYINGAYVGGGPGSGPAAAASDYSIGVWKRFPFYFAGSISSVTFYNRVLTPDEIAWLNAEPFAMLRPRAARRTWSIPSNNFVNLYSKISGNGQATQLLTGKTTFTSKFKGAGQNTHKIYPALHFFSKEQGIEQNLNNLKPKVNFKVLVNGSGQTQNKLLRKSTLSSSVSGQGQVLFLSKNMSSLNTFNQGVGNSTLASDSLSSVFARNRGQGQTTSNFYVTASMRSRNQGTGQNKAKILSSAAATALYSKVQGSGQQYSEIVPYPSFSVVRRKLLVGEQIRTVLAPANIRTIYSKG